MKKVILAVFLLGSAANETLPLNLTTSTAKHITHVCPTINKLNQSKILNNLFNNKKRVQGSRFKYMAGKQCPKTGVFYNVKGYPIFEKVAVCDLKLPTKVANIHDRVLHSRVATRMLREGIKNGKIDPSKFNNVQISAINLGQSKIPGYTWHHHQNFRRMQLIPEELHATPHNGGFSLWNKN
ncbi:MAG: HNH endonuclease [Alphaproteobacteria bacterium]|nr:HNH endonuclease [Alphaproteobacteria bacterium]